MTDQPFVHLHVHTEYSLLDGLSRISKLVDRAKAMEMPALAITDHGTMFGVIDFYRACKKAGVKPIIGLEGYLARRGMRDRDAKLDTKPFHLLMLAKSQDGYRNLLKIASASQLEGYYYRPRIDRDFLSQHSDGLVVTSGCLAAQIPSMIMEGREQEARDLIDWYLQTFGKDNFFLELQSHAIDELKIVNNWLIEIGKKDDVRLVATNDVHYVLDTDYDPHDTLLCIQSSALKTDTNRLKMSDNSYYLSSKEEMWKLFGHINDGEALKNTQLVADMCDLNLDTKGYHLPVFPVPDGYTAESYMRKLCEKGLHWRYGSHADDPDIRARLDFELNTIHNMGFDTYFLIVWDLCEFARHADIWWNVRGSGAGSMAAYCLGITNIDPLQNNLLFERFLNPGRVSMPDIDIDYPEDRRAEMIAYTVRKYGEDKVAAIITFGTLGAKAAVRDVGRALGVPLEKVNKAASLIPTEPKPKKVKEYIEANPELQKMYETDLEVRKVMDTAEQLQGVNRHASTHAAGIIVGDKPLVEYIPLHRQTKGGDDENIVLKQVTQFPMETCESIGLLKVDFLGLSTLTILRRACDLIEKHHGIKYNMSNIPYRPGSNEEENHMLRETFEMIGRGETIGVFQVESSGMQQMLRGMRPTKFEHIVAGISLYRPGPMDYIPTYNNRMHGKEQVQYHHPKLEAILGETYGICISGDSMVTDTVTGQRYQIRDLKDHNGAFFIQGVDEQYQTQSARVTDWIFSGHKEVYRLTLRNGSQIKATADHRFLTEEGWKPLGSLQPGDYLATPPYLIEPEQPIEFSREKLRVLAYLIGDGSLASGASVDFVSKDQALIDEYVRCLQAFDKLEIVYLKQIRDVTRVSVKNSTGKATNSLLKWMRELGLKQPAGVKPAGLRSQDKFIPEFIFQLGNEEIAYFLASIWDCDGYVGNTLSHYKTISEKLAYDIQTLLLRLGISSVIHRSTYTSTRGERNAYQITTYDTAKLAQLLQPYMLTPKAQVRCTRYTKSTINRNAFIAEVDSKVSMSRHELMREYGIDRQHFAKKRLSSERISTQVVRGIAEAIPLEKTRSLINLVWEEVESIEYVGIEDVYDLTVEGLHNFISQNIILHNCVYQEQIMQIAGKLFGYTLADADLMRRAVSKKKKEDLQKHRDIFIKNGPQIDPTVTEEIAVKIFDDIEFFANYGFNKSHAADYGVITVQTAYLKTHYPAEYMAALLSVYYDDETKVTTFLTECKRLNIPILPPDVNHSELDFDIQKQADGRRGIRFGMAAIKNAGVGALQYIIDARTEGGQFKDLEDFCRRVDLRKVGKRALESLIKVGAMTSMGKRPQLLGALERMVSYSTDLHKAKDIGQVSMFGGMTGIQDSNDDLLANLPNVEEATTREMLNWEKELMGLYVTSHPIDPVMDILQHIEIDHTFKLKEMAEEGMNGHPVKLVALVAGLRKMPTKNKDMMAIAQLEDRYGTIDSVLFPRTWKQFEAVLVEGSVVLIKGKLDISRGDPQIICEDVTTSFETVTPDDLPPPIHQSNQPQWMQEMPTNTFQEPEPVAVAQHYQAEPVYTTTSAEPPNWDDVPPPWLQEGDALLDLPPGEDEHHEQLPPRQITIDFNRTEDQNRDMRRLRTIYSILNSYPGRDQFTILIHAADGDYHLDFPNNSTDYCDRLMRDLTKWIPPDNIKVS